MAIDPKILQANYRLLVEALRPSLACWNQSVIQGWPECRAAVPDEWIEPLFAWSSSDLHELDEWISSGGHTSVEPIQQKIPRRFFEYMSALKPLIHFPLLANSYRLPAEKCVRMNPKKQHEISAILGFLQGRSPSITRGVDIGGGAGHLARSLVSELNLPMISIDRDQALQDLGRSLLKKSGMAEAEPSLRFLASEVQAGDQPEIDRHFHGACLSLGLHTCGPLAMAHLRKSRSSHSLLNFGCCYDRMTPEQDCHQSRFAQEHPLPISSYALFLATRGRRRTADELVMQERVNSYRFALHLFLQDEQFCTGFISVGDAPRSAYLQDFAFYAADRMRSLGWSDRFSADRARQFVQNPLIQKSMREFFLVNLLRNCFARPLEVLLLLDRALWLAEQGRDVTILQFFEQQTSPRNLGIFAQFPA